MTALEDLIRAEISSGGPMRFDRFMELALYQPGLGYYAQERAIGQAGDFYTSVSVGPLFGRLLARQFFQMWGVMGKPATFWVIEQGAHDGQLARDILAWCRAETPDFGHALRYGIVQGPVVEGATSFADLNALAAARPAGVFFSNELVDAFPVRVVTYRAGQWRERCVAVAREALAWTDQPVDDPQLLQAIHDLRLPVVEAYTTEINLRARAWIAQVARALERGYVVTLDYGFPAHEYYAAHRPAGTLRAYARHRLVDDVLAEPGARDLTAHVDFTALSRAGKEAGLTTLGFVDQQRFLMGIAHDELAGLAGPRTGIADHVRAWQTLTHPDFLGAKFHALVQAKDAPGGLDGLRFARAED